MKKCKIKEHTEIYIISKTGGEGCYNCRKEYLIEYRKKNGVKIGKKFAFGGNYELVLKRDNYTCVECGMTNDEHLDNWGRAITIDHIDGNGRYKKVNNKNNAMDNLQTLCLRCHGKKDHRRKSSIRQLNTS